MSDEFITLVVFALVLFIGALAGANIVDVVADEREQHLIAYSNTMEKCETHELDEVNATLTPTEIIAWGETTKIREEHRR